MCCFSYFVFYVDLFVLGRSQFEIVVNTVRDSDELNLPDSFKANLPLTFMTDDTSTVISDLLPGVEYIFRLKALGLQGQLSNEESQVIGITCKHACLLYKLGPFPIIWSPIILWSQMQL